MPDQSAVLVVGGGPSGLVMAAELARHGVICRVVESLTTRPGVSKALAIQPRTLEEMATMGVIDDILAAGIRVHGISISSGGKRVVQVGLDDPETAYSYIVGLSQAETERILEAHAARLGAKLERGVRLTALSQDDAGVTATLTHDGGREEKTRVEWLVGCDGAHSVTRHALGLSFDGAKYDEAFVLADVRVRWDRQRDEGHGFLSPKGMSLALPLPGDDRWRLIAALGEERIDHTPTFDELMAIMHARDFDPAARIDDPKWVASFTVHRRIAPSFRSGRVFLAGDAAHIHSPIGGQGMNTGIQDAYNLGWKLALVVRGQAQASILDSYDAERRPIAAATIHGTDLGMKVVTLRNPIARELRNALASFLSSIEAVLTRIVRAAFELTVGYRKSPIVGEDGAWLGFGGGAPAPGDRPPDMELADGTRLFDALRSRAHVALLFATPDDEENPAEMDRIRDALRARWGERVTMRVVASRATSRDAIADPDGAIRRRYGAAPGCLYLLRPDGYVGYRAQPRDLKKLTHYLESIFV